MRQTSTHIDGVQVIAREPAVMRHPHPGYNGRMVNATGINQLLLSDGRELAECDHCGVRKETVQSAVAHLSSHSPEKHRPLTSENTIRTLIRLVRQFERDRVRGKCDKAAAELNRLGLKPALADRWDAAAVSRIYRRYRSAYRTHIRGSRVAVSPTATPAAVVRTRETASDVQRAAEDNLRTTAEVVVATLDMFWDHRDRNLRAAEYLNRNEVPSLSGLPWTKDTVKQVRLRHGHLVSTPTRRVGRGAITDPTPTQRVERMLVAAETLLEQVSAASGELRTTLNRIRDDVTSLADATAPATPDPELVEKARKWDKFQEMQRLLNS